MIHLFNKDGQAYNFKDAHSAGIFMWGRDTTIWFIAIPGCVVVDCQTEGGCVPDVERKIAAMIVESQETKKE